MYKQLTSLLKNIIIILKGCESSMRKIPKKNLIGIVVAVALGFIIKYAKFNTWVNTGIAIALLVCLTLIPYGLKVN